MFLIQFLMLSKDFSCVTSYTNIIPCNDYNTSIYSSNHSWNTQQGITNNHLLIITCFINTTVTKYNNYLVLYQWNNIEGYNWYSY